jgi:hypothetical protein
MDNIPKQQMDKGLVEQLNIFPKAVLSDTFDGQPEEDGRCSKMPLQQGRTMRRTRKIQMSMVMSSNEKNAAGLPAEPTPPK